MVGGDDHCEAYTAIVWGGLLSRERYYAAEAEAVDRAEGNMCGPVMRGSIAQPWSETLSRTKGTSRNLGDLAFGRAEIRRAGPHGEGDDPKLMMNGREKSVPVVVAVKSMNEAGQPGEEWMEPREMWAGKSRSELSVGQACHMRWVTYGVPCNCG